MMLRKTEIDSQRVWLARGTHGHTVQTVEAYREKDGVRLTTARLGSSVTVDLDISEVEALRDWLSLGPQSQEES